jgi:hypothetical protein
VNDGVVRDIELVQDFEELPNMHVVLDHAGGIFIGFWVFLCDFRPFFLADMG